MGGELTAQETKLFHSEYYCAVRNPFLTVLVSSGRAYGSYEVPHGAGKGRRVDSTREVIFALDII